ncbi:MAG: hypothetical protein HN521_20980 [Candidatus Latescibacteria bacterium]|jgi:hypothetical protein|nr:hypothetical protein [Candidatus Latescibacterota bacterium]MBT5833163.1 hypothetical protein [Candidatus Latescibacterota bacterium]
MKNLTFTNWLPFAWQGIQLQIPADWNPGKITGEPNNGGVRLDDAQIVRLELEWKDARGDDRVEQIVDRYIEGLAKNAEKQKSKLKVERSAELNGLDLPQMQNVTFFNWQSNFIVYTLACYSPISDRLLFVRIMGRHDENLEEILPRILNSLIDTDPKGPQSWALYDMACTSPAGYQLESFELKSGHVRLKFEQDNNTLIIDRLGLAKTILANKTLDKWYPEFFGKDSRHIHTDFKTEETEDTNLALKVTGRPKSRWRGLLQPLPFWNMRPRQHLTGQVWTDFEANKIFAVQGFWKKQEDAPDVQACIDTVRAVEPQT